MVHPTFGPEVALIFIGYSEDARDEAEAVYALEPRLQEILETGPLHTVKMWTWEIDGLSMTGGQDEIVNPILDRADVALFVFKHGVGKGTWRELEHYRSRGRGRMLLTFFPRESRSMRVEVLKQATGWHKVAKSYKKLTKDWLAPGSRAVKPTSTYTTEKTLLDTAERELLKVLAHLSTMASRKERPRGGDTDLLWRWQRGDDEAGAALMKLHFKHLRRFFEHMVGPSDARTESLIQKTYLRWTDPANRPEHWSSFSVFKYWSALTTLADEDPEPSAPGHAGPEPDGTTGRSLLLTRLRILPLELRALAVLVFLENSSILDACEVIGSSDAEALPKLRKVLREIGEGLSEGGGASPPADDALTLLESWLGRLPPDAGDGDEQSEGEEG